MAKHGAEMHFVRPDFVHRTSVLQAIPGYQPVSNAYEVAARFTAAPYFATTLSGNVDIVTRFKLWWLNVKARWQAKRVPAAAQAVAALAPPVASYGDQVQPGLPNSGEFSPESTQYGVGPAHQAMSNIGLMITQGAVQAGSAVSPPSIAITQQGYAKKIDPDMYLRPGEYAAMIQAGVPSVISDRAIKAAMNRWNGQRNWWWWNLS